MSTTTTTTTLQDMWDTRPPRIPKKQGSNAPIAGVCEGIGVRYQIDPTLVRVAFAALTLVLGGGFFLYLLCWFTMPRFGLATSAAQAVVRPKDQLTPAERADRSTGWMLVVLIIVFFPTLSIGTFGAATASALGGLIVAGLAWWALHERVPVPPPGLLVPQQGRTLDDVPPTPQPVVTGVFTAPDGYPHPAAGRTTPPAWDPLGTAPNLWHLPDPNESFTYEASQEPRPKRRRWLWFLVPVGVIAIMLTSVAASVTDSMRYYNFYGATSGVGALSIRVNGADNIPQVRHIAGDVKVDLSELGELEQQAGLEAGNYFGNMTIILPENTPTDVTCDVGIGSNTTCPNSTVNPDGKGEKLLIDARQLVGEINVVTYPEAVSDGYIQPKQKAPAN